MFEDVPEELNRWILDAPEELREPHTLHTLAAMCVTKFYLGTTLGDADDDPLLAFKQVKPDTVAWQNTMRRWQIANALFSLRNQPGFPEICRRFSKLDLRAAFFEAFAASLFLQLGFAIHSRPTRQIYGEDFDFTIKGHDTETNVEATAFRDNRFNEASIRNSLRHKRGQVPDDKPAIIVCVVPGTWRFTVLNFESELKALAERFLRGTRRINYLFFVEDLFVSRGEGGMALTHVLHYANQNPRHQSPELEDRISRGRAISAEVISAISAAAQGDPQDGGTGELQGWLDWLLSRD